MKTALVLSISLLVTLGILMGGYLVLTGRVPRANTSEVNMYDQTSYDVMSGTKDSEVPLTTGESDADLQKDDLVIEQKLKQIDAGDKNITVSLSESEPDLQE